MVDIHNCERRLQSILKVIQESPTLSNRNREAICRFHLHCFAEGLSTPRVVKYLYTLYRLTQLLGKDFEDANVDDIRELAGKIERSKYSEWTKRDYRITLKKFYRWLRKTEDYPGEVKWLKSHLRRNRRRLPEELLTEDEVKKLIEVTGNPRDRAMIAVLYESGCRVGELASLRLKDISFDEYGAKLLVNGKTGARMVRIIASIPYLTEWINMHPSKDDPKQSLWTTRDYRNTAITYGGIKRILLLAKRKSRVKKKVNPHNFRHSRATYMAKHLTEAQMKQVFGWTQSSDMAAVYVHLSGRDVDDPILRMNGIVKEEGQREESKLKPKKCQRCGCVNPATTKFCGRCGTILDVETAIQLDDVGKKSNEMMTMLVKNPEIQKVLLSKIMELGLGEQLLQLTGNNRQVID